MAKPVIALVNVSTCWADAEIAAFLPALQQQVTHDFAPVWGKDADLIFYVDRTAPLMPSAWPMFICDDSDQPGAFGYHDIRKNYQPAGFCFAGTDKKYNEDPRITLSHEVLELLADPWCAAIRSVTFQGKRVQTLCEVCDAVEDDRWAYHIDGHPVSDFVYPAFFDTDGHPPPAAPAYDFCGVIKAPMTIAPGGYLSTFDPKSGDGWVQSFGEQVPLHKRLPPKGSRRERFTLRENHGRSWQVSTADL